MPDLAAGDAAAALGSLVPEGVGARFWAALASQRLELPWCVTCSQAFFYPRIMCPRCWSLDLEWRPSPGRGTVFSSTEVSVPFQGLDETDLPLWIVLVDLDEGVRIPGQFETHGREPRIGTVVVPTWSSLLPGPLVFTSREVQAA